LASRATAVIVPALDYPLIAIVATLLAVGLVEVYSASFMLYGSYFFTLQLWWIGVGVVVLFAMALIPFRFWQQAAVPIMAITLLLLVLVLLFGKDAYGARRTLLAGRLQPSEFTKFAVVIYVAAWVASKKKHLKDVRAGLIPFAIVMGVVGGLVVLEKSFSVTIVILIAGVAIFFLGGGDVKQLLITGLIAGAVLLLLIYKFNYGVLRIHEWWQALTDPNNAPYNVAQVHEIIRRGGGIGTRPDNWLQKDRVPLLWSDYLFANIAADFKFIGAMTVVVLFAALGYRGLSIGLSAPDEFGGLAGIGVTTWILAQAIVHMGTSVAMIPATGIPLPFMSYGGSAMVASLAGVGLLLSISRASPDKRAPYESFGLGWRNGRARLSDPGSDERHAPARTSGKPRLRRRANLLTRIRRAVGPARRERSHTSREDVGATVPKARPARRRAADSRPGNARR
jgi:cell division protein FtsW